MSYRDFWDEESFQEYKANLIRERNKLNPVTNQLHIKILDDMIKNLPERYSDYCDKKENCEQLNDSPLEQDSTPTKVTFKERIANSLGAFGVVLYFVIRIIIAILPFVMIGGNFFLTLFLISINTFVPFASVVFWIWGLVCAIKGVQDIWAIIYYIAFVLIWIPFFISTIVSMFSKE